MAQPTPFGRSADYSDDAANSAGGRTTIDPTKLDAEFDAVETTLDGVLTNLALIQRDDGKIRDGKVELHTLSAQVKALIAAAGATIQGDWVTATSYAVNDVVTESDATYICATAHTSGVFATDLAADKWVMLMFAPSALAASGVSSTPAGSLAASNVQDALDELDGDITALTAVVAAIDELPLSGGTMTGKITLDGAPTSDLHAATKAYADDVINAIGTMAGRLEYSSATQLVLQVFNGNRFFINGDWLTIPSGGATLSNSGLSANTTYYIYAYNNAGSIALEASTTARATDTTYGHQIKNGDATRTLVGMCRTNGSSQFQSTPALVISWMNRKWRRVTNNFSANRSTASLTQVELNSEIRCEFLVWSSSIAQLAASGSASNNGSSSCFTFIGVDGTSIRANGSSANANFTAALPYSCQEPALALSEGYHYATLCGYVGTGTGTWNGGTNANSARLSVLVEG